MKLSLTVASIVLPLFIHRGRCPCCPWSTKSTSPILGNIVAQFPSTRLGILAATSQISTQSLCLTFIEDIDIDIPIIWAVKQADVICVKSGMFRSSRQGKRRLIDSECRKSDPMCSSQSNANSRLTNLRPSQPCIFESCLFSEFNWEGMDLYTYLVPGAPAYPDTALAMPISVHNQFSAGLRLASRSLLSTACTTSGILPTKRYR